MKKISKPIVALAILAGALAAPITAAFADDAPDATKVNNEAKKTDSGSGGFLQVIYNPKDPDILGTILWLVIFGDLALAIYFIIDNMILIKPEKLMPRRVVDNVQAAMSEGDVVKAMQVCEQNPSAMSSIVMAAFQHVEEGFEAIQEAVTAASDLEQEKIQQRLNWISVCGNLGPSLGLLGTVEGMILTFAKLAQGSAGDASALAGSIGQALYTTAGGLIISIPSITFFYSLRNKANRLILRMTAVTMELLNSLRNVEVAPEEGAGEEMQA